MLTTTPARLRVIVRERRRPPGSRGLLPWGLAGFLLLLPFAGLFPFTGVRFSWLATPARPPAQPLDPTSLGIIMQPDALAAFALLLLAITQTRGLRAGSLSGRTLTILAGVGGATLLGGALATASSAWPHASVVGLTFRMAAIGLGATVLLSSPTEATVRLWCRTLVAGVGVVAARAAVVYVQTFGDIDVSDLPGLRTVPEFQDYQLVFFGTSGENSSALLMVIPLAVTLAFTERQWRWRLMAGGALTAMLVNMAFSFQRYSLLLLAIGLVLLVLRWGLNKRAVAIVAVSCAGVLEFGGKLVNQFGPYFTSALDPASGSSVAGRWNLIQEGLGLIRDVPSGYGFGSVGALGISEGSSHNQFVDIGIEGGVVVVGAWLVWSIFVGLLFFRAAVGSRDREFAFALLLGVILFQLKGFSSAASLFGGSGTWIWLVLWFVLPAMAVATLEAPEQPHSAPSTVRRLRRGVRVQPGGLSRSNPRSSATATATPIDRTRAGT